MKVLVTGGAGYIGSTVSNLLLDMGHEVTIIDNLSRGMKKNIPKLADFYKVDISNKKKLNIIFSKKKIELVIHFAAYIDNEESFKQPHIYIKNNYLKAKIFFECCIENNIKKFILSSTAAVYGNKDKPIKEDDKLMPMSPYSKSKLKLEKFLEKKKNFISCIVLRYFNVAGCEQKLRCGFNIKNNQNLILNLCLSSIKKVYFTINGLNYNTKDGSPIRDYIHVKDLAYIHLLVAKLILRKKIFQIVNCGYGKGYSVKEILLKFNSISDNKILYKIGKRRKNDIAKSISNTEKLFKLIKWKPKYNNLTPMLKSSLDWYKKNLIMKKIV